MIQITPQMRIFVAVEAADFRKGIDGLCQLCRCVLKSDPFSGAVFVFRNKRRTAISFLFLMARGIGSVINGSARENSSGGHGLETTVFIDLPCMNSSY
ncbi:MAG: IS66 family insertion sequence element accessory protein TnpB [Gammaproteobacteria bacterium]|nr:IS66 family insertion sequence element accessory protein TnpB [Gammaproteobacteria bacterium]